MKHQPLTDDEFAALKRLVNAAENYNAYPRVSKAMVYRLGSKGVPVQDENLRDQPHATWLTDEDLAKSILAAEIKRHKAEAKP